jgi:hypothetical protein
MIKLTLKALLLSLFIFIQSNCQVDQDSLMQLDQDVKSNIILRTYVESESVPLNLEVVYHIELKWYGDLNRYKISELKEPTATNLIHRGSGSRNIVSTDTDGRILSIKIITYYFKPVEMGMAYVDGILIKYEDMELGQEGNLLSSRVGVKIVDPLPEPSDRFGFGELIIIIIVLLVIILTVYFVLRYQKQKKKDREKDLLATKETVEEKYLRLLKETVKLDSENIKESIVDLSHLLSGYFSECFGIPAINLSTNDLIGLLSDRNMEEQSLSRIKEFYTQVDLIKFAGRTINESELHRLYDTVELILNSQNQRDVQKNV